MAQGKVACLQQQRAVRSHQAISFSVFMNNNEPPNSKHPALLSSLASSLYNFDGGVFYDVDRQTTDRFDVMASVVNSSHHFMNYLMLLYV